MTVYRQKEDALSPDGLPPSKRLKALVVIVLGLLVSVLDSSIANLALPAIMSDLHASAASSIWILNAYQLAVLGLLLPFANLGDRLGHSRVYLWGLALFTVASLLCAIAPNLPLLAAARALQGIGSAGIMSVNAAMVRQIYPRHLLGRGLAVNSLVVAASSVAGPTVAAAILSIASWPWLFLVNIPLGVVTLWLGRTALPRAQPTPHPTEWTLTDGVLNVLMFSLVFLGVDGLGTHFDMAPGTAAAAAATSGDTLHRLLLPALELLLGVALGVWYVLRQRRMTRPLFPLDLLKMPIFALSMCSSVSAFAAQTITFAGLPFLLLSVHGRTPLEAGLLLTAWPLAVVVTAPIVGRLIGRWPGGKLGASGMVLMALGLALLALMPPPAQGASQGLDDFALVWRLALCGVGFALFQSPNNHIILTAPPSSRSGAASGMLGTGRLTGQTLGAVMLAIVFSFFPISSTAFGPTLALWVAVVCALLSSIASVLRQPPKDAPATRTFS